MPLPSYYNTGSASVANGATTVTFAFAGLGSDEFPFIQGGDTFCDPAQPLVPEQRIASVDYDAGTAELWVAWPGTTMSADPYEIRLIGDSARSSAQTRRLLEQLSVVEANGRGLFYRFSDLTTDADPGAGALRLNHATVASATAAYLDNLDANGATVAAVLDTWDNSTTTVRGQLWLRKISDPAVFHAFNVTGSVVDGTGYRKITLAYVGGAGALSLDDELMVFFAPTGDIGATGAPGTTIIVPLTGRLTLTSAAPVTSSDVSGATSIYYTPAGGNVVPIYDGSIWAMHTFAELALALDSNSGHIGYHQSGKNFDLFIVDDGGTIRLGTGPAWSSDTARGTGAGTTELETFGGLPVNKNSMTLRFGSASGNTLSVAARRATLVGSVRMTSNGTTEDSVIKRFLSNAYNLAQRRLRKNDISGNWTYSTSTFRQANASSSNQVEILNCLDGAMVDMSLASDASNSTSTERAVIVAIGLDSTTAEVTGGFRNIGWSTNTRSIAALALWKGDAGSGYHKITWLEYGAGADTQTWRAFAAYGLQGTTWA